MKVKVLKSFPYSKDGVNSKYLQAGDDGDINPGHFAGLSAEGFVAALDGAAEQSKSTDVTAASTTVVAADVAVSVAANVEAGESFQAVRAALVESETELGAVADTLEDERVACLDAIEIPENWEKLKFFGLKALAEKISGADVKDAASAKAAIRAELERRANRSA